MTEFQELTQDAPNFVSMERRELVAYAYGMFAAGTKANAENAKLRELSSIMLKCIMANERKKLICWECPMHKQFDELRSYCCLEHEAKKLGVGVYE